MSNRGTFIRIYSRIKRKGEDAFRGEGDGNISRPVPCRLYPGACRGAGVLPGRELQTTFTFEGYQRASPGREGRFVHRLPYFKGGPLKSPVYQRANYVLYRFRPWLAHPFGHGVPLTNVPGPFRSWPILLSFSTLSFFPLFNGAMSSILFHFLTRPPPAPRLGIPAEDRRAPTTFTGNSFFFFVDVQKGMQRIFGGLQRGAEVAQV